MAAPKCVLVPQIAGYNVKPGSGLEVKAVRLAGGASRYFRDILGASWLVPVQWTVSKKGYVYLQSLFTITYSGALPFLVDLIIRDFGLTEHSAHFIPDTFNLIEKSGNIYIVGAELEVEVDLPDVAAAQDYFDTYSAFGSDWTPMDDLDTLVNITLPGDLPAP